MEKFHVSRLRHFDVTRCENPQDVAARDRDEWIVESIVDHRGQGRTKSAYEFRVRWSGFGEESDTWERYATVKDLEALDVYLRGHPQLRFR